MHSLLPHPSITVADLRLHTDLAFEQGKCQRGNNGWVEVGSYPHIPLPQKVSKPPAVPNSCSVNLTKVFRALKVVRHTQSLAPVPHRGDACTSIYSLSKGKTNRDHREGGSQVSSGTGTTRQTRGPSKQHMQPTEALAALSALLTHRQEGVP